MAIHISNITVGLSENQDKCYDLALQRLGVPAGAVTQQYIVKRSVDARRRNDIRLNYTVGFVVADEETVTLTVGMKLVRPVLLAFTPGSRPMEHPPVVVGFGPAGIFCGLFLARMGYRPVILDRGGRIEDRVLAVQKFHTGGEFSSRCNVQFGEGGAGTFSDGKLTTRINDPRCDAVLAEFVKAGAPEVILREAKPHIGTDYLRDIVAAMRAEIISLGGQVRFDTTLTGLVLQGGRVAAAVTDDGEKIPTQTVVLATGHSARDSFSMLFDLGIPMETKAFSVGARLEHLQTQVDQALYGEFAGHPLLPKGEYQLSWRDEKNNRAAYTFCMCPGGVVIPSASEAGGIVTNGMSNYLRDGVNANSALVVSVDSRDFGTHPLDGIAFQRAIEQKAYQASGSYCAPVQTVGRFLAGESGAAFGCVTPSYSIGTHPAGFDDILPPVVTDYMRRGLRIMGQQQRGFAAVDAVLTAPETRTSSPVRILRDSESLCSPGTAGLYPCGEGSGYAGGIMSAAVDGIRIAEKIIESYKPIA